MRFAYSSQLGLYDSFLRTIMVSAIKLISCESPPNNNNYSIDPQYDMKSTYSIELFRRPIQQFFLTLSQSLRYCAGFYNFVISQILCSSLQPYDLPNIVQVFTSLRSIRYCATRISQILFRALQLYDLLDTVQVFTTL